MIASELLNFESNKSALMNDKNLISEKGLIVITREDIERSSVWGDYFIKRKFHADNIVDLNNQLTEVIQAINADSHLSVEAIVCNLSETDTSISMKEFEFIQKALAKGVQRELGHVVIGYSADEELQAELCLAVVFFMKKADSYEYPHDLI